MSDFCAASEQTQPENTLRHWNSGLEQPVLSLSTVAIHLINALPLAPWFLINSTIRTCIHSFHLVHTLALDPAGLEICFACFRFAKYSHPLYLR